MWYDGTNRQAGQTSIPGVTTSLRGLRFGGGVVFALVDGVTGGFAVGNEAFEITQGFIKRVRVMQCEIQPSDKPQRFKLCGNRGHVGIALFRVVVGGYGHRIACLSFECAKRHSGERVL